MSTANDNSSCPVCGHDGRNPITTGRSAFPPPDLNNPFRKVLTCSVCGTKFAELDTEMNSAKTLVPELSY